MAMAIWQIRRGIGGFEGILSSWQRNITSFKMPKYTLWPKKES